MCGDAFAGKMLHQPMSAECPAKPCRGPYDAATNHKGRRHAYNGWHLAAIQQYEEQEIPNKPQGGKNYILRPEAFEQHGPTDSPMDGIDTHCHVAFF
jgi:hypothetical protein